MRKIHPAGPDRRNCAPRRTMITTSGMRRQRNNILTLRFDDKQVKRWAAISGEPRQSIRDRRAWLNTVEWDADFLYL